MSFNSILTIILEGGVIMLILHTRKCGVGGLSDVPKDTHLGRVDPGAEQGPSGAWALHHYLARM